jgi:hypothetical protein
VDLNPKEFEMAKKKAKGRSVANGEQEIIPELAPKKIPDIHTAAKRYAKVRDQRAALSIEEKAARDHLKNVMEENELVNYEYGDLIVCIDMTCKAVVKSKDSEANGDGADKSEE